MRAWNGIAWSVVAALVLACSPADDGDMPAGEEADEAAAPADVPQAPSADMMNDWNVALDEQGRDPAGFQMVTGEDGFTVETGPAGIAWRAVDLLEQGDYAVSATFTEMGAPADHREAYGIVVGGRHLDSPDLQYTYFLVRGDGNYLIKRRNGESTEELVGWTSSDAVQGVESQGQKSPNELAVRVRGDQVEFLANGTVVETLPADQVEPWGLAGIRINHNLEVAVEGWNVEGATSEVGPDTGAEGESSGTDTAGSAG